MPPEQPPPSEARITDEVRQLAQRPDILFRVFEYAPDANLLIDADGRIIQANSQAQAMFGYPRSELLGQLVELLIPSRYHAQHVGYRSGYINSPRTRPMGAGVELFGRRKNATEFPVDIMLSPLESEEGVLVLAVVRDATERKQIEAEAIEAREMYLKEVHHRVKNNLQVISSLLFLQSSHTTDPNILEILKESQSRVKSIALIHEKLYRSPELGKIDFAGYVRDLVSDLFRTYGVNQESVELQTEIQNIALNIDTAIPCGLIINELVSNVLKHAFPSDFEGKVLVRIVASEPQSFTLTVRDNGVGLPEHFDWRTSASLGLRLVNDLTRQLDGTVEISREGGTTFTISFRELQYRDRG